MIDNTDKRSLLDIARRGNLDELYEFILKKTQAFYIYITISDASDELRRHLNKIKNVEERAKILESFVESILNFLIEHEKIPNQDRAQKKILLKKFEQFVRTEFTDAAKGHPLQTCFPDADGFQNLREDLRSDVADDESMYYRGLSSDDVDDVEHAPSPAPESEPSPQIHSPSGAMPPAPDIYRDCEDLFKPPSVKMEPLPRYADYTFFYGEGARSSQRIPDGSPLQANQRYVLEIAVRVKPTGIPPEYSERQTFREPRQKQEVKIMVAAEGDGVEIDEPVQTLILPPTEDSTHNALFRVRPLSRSVNRDDLAAIRIRMYYQFNLLEVAVIRAEVVGKFDDPSRSHLGLEKPITFTQERLERHYLDLDNIHPRDMHIDITKQGEYFCFNFAFLNTMNQQLIVSAPVRLSASDLDDDLVTIRRLWTDIAMSKTFTQGVEGDKDDFIKNIRGLARAGRNLWTKLWRFDQNSAMFQIGKWLEEHPIKPGGMIQISISKEASHFVFPWNLIYDREPSKKDYELPDIDGFWGTRYCIEHQALDTLKSTDEPVYLEDKLRLEFMLWKDFSNAKAHCQFMEQLMEANHPVKIDVSLPPILNADSCYAVLRDCNAHILYFYTHGYTRHRKADIGAGPDFDLFLSRYQRLDADSPERETHRFLYDAIKKDRFEPDRSWIELSYGKIYLDELYGNVDRFTSNPFVILNMCESAQITPSLSDSFIHFFLDRGAKSVIGTECPMTTEFAHPFAEKFLTDMLTGETIGRVLLNARRHFLNLHNPLGLAYTLFGSATLSFKPLEDLLNDRNDIQ